MTLLAAWTNELGITHSIERTAEGHILDHASQPVADILDRNKAMQTHNDGYTPSRDMVRIASIPATVRLKWMLEEGWDWFDAAHDTDVARKFRQKLNDPEWRHLRTSSLVV